MNMDLGQGTRDSPPHEYRTELMAPEVYEQYWPFVSEQLDYVPGVWAPYFTKEYLRYCVAEKECFVWGTGTPEELRLVVWGRIVQFPASRILQVFLAMGNDLENCLPSLEAAMERLANGAECEWCEVLGRLGWEKRLKGFERSAVVLRKPLTQFRIQ